MTDTRAPPGGSVSSEVRLIAIPPMDMKQRHLVDRCLAVEQGGASAVQLRFKGIPAAEFLRTTELVLSKLAIPVFVNDRADVARLAGAAGAHMGADDLAPRTIRAVLPRPFRVGVSVGSRREAVAAREGDADYWSIGPFYKTSTKVDAGRALGVDGYRKLAMLCPPTVPVIAIGGIHMGNVAEVVRAGADGIAVVGAIFGRPDVETATRLLRTALDAA